MQNMSREVGDRKGPETVIKKDPGNKAMGSTIGLLYNKRK
jgi:hypothetical protein